MVDFNFGFGFGTSQINASLQTGGNSPWTPADLFTSGEDGAWYDLSDVTSLFQDTSGLVPVTTAGQSVGKILDKSGNGYHLLADDDLTKQPTYGVTEDNLCYISFDGNDDGMSVSGFSDNLFVGVAPYVDSTASLYSCAMHFTAQGDRALLAIDNGTTYWRNDTQQLVYNDTGMRINGVETRNFGSTNTPHVLTMNKTYPFAADECILGSNVEFDLFTGRFYGSIILLGREVTTEELNNIENYLRIKAGL